MMYKENLEREHYPNAFVILICYFSLCRSKALVASRSDTEPLNLKLVRNTAVMANHEAALTELCANPDTSDEEAEQCVLEYLQGGYYDDDNTDDSFVLCDEDNENECVLDDLHNLWAADLSPTIVQPLKVTPQSVSTTTATKPWSSRASPSGTFVRDPVTGVMRNIDS